MLWDCFLRRTHACRSVRVRRGVHAALRWLLRRTARALILVASGKRAMAYDTAEQVLENKPT